MKGPDPLAVGLAVLERFTRCNDERHAQGERLSEAIRGILAKHADPVPMRAEAVHALLQQAANLGRDTPPSLRTVQRHLSAIRTRVSRPNTELPHVGTTREPETS